MARNEWFTAVEQTLPEYVPLPMDRLFQAGQLIQNRYDENMKNLNDVGTGLASIEARLPGHREYVNNLANNYREESQSLLDKYNGNASDPQFQREFNRLKNRFSSDRNLSTIMLANEGAKRNDELSARLAAEGKLFVNPQTTGLDANGNIISDVGQIRQVNTLNDWANRLKMAADTMSEEGNVITNKTSLDKAKNQISEAIKSGSPEVLDLVQAYETRGMTRDQALTQVAQDAKRMAGEYAESSKTNFQKLSFEHNVKMDMQKLAMEKERLNLARQQSASSAQADMPAQAPKMFETTSTTEGNNVIPITNKIHDINIPMFGRATTPIRKEIPKGVSEKTGKYHVFHDGRVKNTYNVKNGSYKFEDDGYQETAEAPYVFTGVVLDNNNKPISRKESSNKGKIVGMDEGFKVGLAKYGTTNDLKMYNDDYGTYILTDDKRGKMYVQPQAMMKYSDGDNVVYRELSSQEAIMHLGAEYGHLSNDGYSTKDINTNSNLFRASAQGVASRLGRQPTIEEVAPVYFMSRDTEEYNRLKSNDGKPKTTTSISDFYGR